MRNDNFLSAYGQRKESLKFWETSRHQFSDLYPSEQKFLRPCLAEATSVLDVGCAAGGGASFTREINPSLFYAGIDSSAELIELARKKQDERTLFSTYDGHHLNFDSRTYDLVFSLGVLHHVPHWRELITEMYKKANTSICFDLRLTHENNPAYENPVESFQKIAFNEEWDGKTRVPYLVLNFSKVMQFLETLINSKDRCELFGYYGKPTSLAVTPAKEVLMASFCIRKNSPQPGFEINYARQ